MRELDGLAEAILLTGAAGATLFSGVAGGFAYGLMEAKGTPLPGKEYFIGATLVGSFFVSQKLVNFVTEDQWAGVKGTGITAAIGASAYGLGYLVGRLN